MWRERAVFSHSSHSLWAISTACPPHRPIKSEVSSTQAPLSMCLKWNLQAYSRLPSLILITATSFSQILTKTTRPCSNPFTIVLKRSFSQAFPLTTSFCFLHPLVWLHVVFTWDINISILARTSRVNAQSICHFSVISSHLWLIHYVSFLLKLIRHPSMND